MTEAKLIVDPASIVVRSSGPATGEIALVVGDITFPMVGWNDFVVVILEAWLDALHRIVRLTSDAERVHFMDGPYSVDIAHLHSGAIQVRVIEMDQERGVVEARPLPLVENAIDAADRVLTCCRRQGHHSVDVARLELALTALRQEVPGLAGTDK